MTLPFILSLLSERAKLIVVGEIWNEMVSSSLGGKFADRFMGFVGEVWRR